MASANSDGTAPRFVLKAKGTVISGELLSQTFEIEQYEKFLKLELLTKMLLRSYLFLIQMAITIMKWTIFHKT